MTKTFRNEIIVRECLAKFELNNSQRWYFYRGLTKANTAFALVSYTDNSEKWTAMVQDDVGAGAFSIRPKYTECVGHDGRCYDLPSGILKDYVPFYGH